MSLVIVLQMLCYFMLKITDKQQFSRSVEPFISENVNVNKGFNLT